MIEYFELKESLLLTLFSLVALKISGSALLLAIPYTFLFLGSAGLENSLNYELNRIYHPGRFGPDFREAHKISFLFLLMAVMFAYYFQVGCQFLIVILLLFASHWIKSRYSFLSDLLYFFSFLFLFSIPLSLEHIPFAWTVALLLYLRRAVWDLILPYGMENFNLAKLMGMGGAQSAFYLISALVMMWMAVPAVIYYSLYASLYAIPFSFVFMAIYLVKTGRQNEVPDVLDGALLSYLLVSIFL